MGNNSSKNNRTSSPGRVLLLPMLGTIVLILVIMVSILNRNNNSWQPSPGGEIAATLPANPYAPGDFEYKGDYLTCTTGKTRLGVDVSEHQQQVDWKQVKDAGMDFAFVRIGYRGYTEGMLYQDESAEQNLTGAKKAGLKIGAYFYSQAISPVEAAQEAAFCISFLQKYDLDLPVVFDWEYVSSEARTADVDMQTITDCAKVFCEAIKDAGYEAMVYFNPSITTTHLDLVQLQEYPFWLSLYSDTMDYPHKVEFWQYTQDGKVPGIPGDADINLWFID